MKVPYFVLYFLVELKHQKTFLDWCFYKILPYGIISKHSIWYKRNILDIESPIIMARKKALGR